MAITATTGTPPVAMEAGKTLLAATEGNIDKATAALKTAATSQLNPNIGPQTQQADIGTCKNCQA